MEQGDHTWLSIIIAFVVAMAVYLFFSLEPVARRINLLEPKDPEKGMKIFFIILIALWVIVGLAVSFGILWRALKGAG